MRTIRLDRQHQERQDRRSEPRYPAIENASEVGWWHDGEFRLSAAQLMDISRDGLLVLVDVEPSRGGLVLVRMIAPSASEWVATELVESEQMRIGPFQLRLVFRGTPPDDFIDRARAAGLDEDDD